MNSELRTAASTGPASRAQTYVRRKGRRTLLSVLVLMGLALGTLAVIIIYRARPRPQAPSETIEPLPDNAEQSAAGYSFTRSEHDHPVFTIRAQRSLDLKGGNGTLLEGVEVEIFGRAGDQHELLKTERCQYKPNSGNFFCAGQVAIELDAPPGARVPGTPANTSAGVAPRGRMPVFLQTSALSYNQQQGLATTPARVKWRYGNASGAALGLKYSTREGWLELDREVAATIPVAAPDGPDKAAAQVPLVLTAAHLRYTKGQIELTGPLQVDEGRRQVAAGHAIAYLDAQNRITSALLDQGVRASDPSQDSLVTAQANTMHAEFDPASGNLKDIQADGSARLESKRDSDTGSTRLEADHLQTSFVGEHFHPAQGMASGNVHLSSDAVRSSPKAAAPPGTSQGSLAGEDLRAGRLDFTFRPADGTLNEAHTVGPGSLVLSPSSPKAGKRDVTAGQFQMAFDARSRLESLHGLAPTRIVFEPAPSAPAKAVPMESRAQDLRAELDPETGSLKSIKQSGEFQFVDGDQRANADRADFAADAQVLTLEGRPELLDPQTRIRADHVVMHLDIKTAEGFGHVSSTRKGGLESEGVGARRQAASASSGEPGSQNTNVLAERVTADRARGLLHYEGHARAWQGAHVVESPVIDIYRTERRMVAGSPVLTSDLAPATVPAPSPSPPTESGKTPSKPIKSASHASAAHAPVHLNTGQPPGTTEPAVIRADRLEYFDSEGRAVYRGHVRMDALGATLTSDRLDAYFTEQAGEGSTLDHAVADGNVVVVQPGRRAAGHHAEYDAVAGKIVLTGGPPTLYDSEKGYVTGRVLTFFNDGGSLLVDGGDGYRTLSQHRSTK
jgi:lipopolysaccharide export system protein LptA